MIASLILASGEAHASAAPQANIHVTLFGQPCLLQGPVDQKALKTIHSMSPEQVYPERGATLVSEPTRKSIEKIKNISGLPAALERYRERLTKRLEAQLALLDAMEDFGKAKKTDAMLAAGKKYLTAAKLKEFSVHVKKAEGLKSLRDDKGREAADAIFDAFSDAIEADPEEEFHRAIHRMNVQYTCSFDQAGDNDGEADSEETSP